MSMLDRDYYSVLINSTSGEIHLDSDRVGLNRAFDPTVNMSNIVTDVIPSESSIAIRCDNRNGTMGESQRASSILEGFDLTGVPIVVRRVSLRLGDVESTTVLWSGSVTGVDVSGDSFTISASSRLENVPYFGVKATSDDLPDLLPQFEGIEFPVYYNAIGEIAPYACAEASASGAKYWFLADKDQTAFLSPTWYHFVNTVNAKTTPVDGLFRYRTISLCDDDGAILPLYAFQGTTNAPTSAFNYNSRAADWYEYLWPITGAGSHTTGLDFYCFLFTRIYMQGNGVGTLIEGAWKLNLYAVPAGSGNSPAQSLRIAETIEIPVTNYQSQINGSANFEVDFEWDRPIILDTANYDYIMGIENLVYDRTAGGGLTGKLRFTTGSTTLWSKYEGTPTGSTADTTYYFPNRLATVYPYFRNAYLEFVYAETQIDNYYVRGASPKLVGFAATVDWPKVVGQLDIYGNLSGGSNTSPLEMIKNIANKTYSGGWTDIETITEKDSTITAPDSNNNFGIIKSSSGGIGTDLIAEALRQCGVFIYTVHTASGPEYKVWRYGSYEARQELGPDEFTVLAYTQGSANDCVRKMEIEGLTRELPTDNLSADIRQRKTGFNQIYKYSSATPGIYGEILAKSVVLQKTPAISALSQSTKSPDLTAEYFFRHFSNPPKFMSISIHTSNKLDYEHFDILRLTSSEIPIGATRIADFIADISYQGDDVEHQTNILSQSTPTVDLLVEGITTILSGGSETVVINGRIIEHPYEVI